MEGVQLERVGEAERVARHVGDLVRARGQRGLAHVPVVEDDRPVAGREGGQLEQPGERVGGQPHHAEQRLALAVDLVVERLSVDLGRWHQASLLGKIV
jgi:hypothetical protein